MPTANENLLNQALLHQVELRRFTKQEVRALLTLLQQFDAQTAAYLRRELANAPLDAALAELSPGQKRSLDRAMTGVTLLRKSAWKQLQAQASLDLTELAGAEAAIERLTIENSIPIVFAASAADPVKIKAMLQSQPIAGRFFDVWVSELNEGEVAKIREQLTLGMLRNETVDQLTQRVVGTRKNSFTDGVLSASRRSAEALVRTAIVDTSNRAREEVWKANEDILEGLRWNATLDGRTSAFCRGQDGALILLGNSSKAPVGYRLVEPQSARPPAHINCRSTLVPILLGEQILADKTFVIDTRTDKQRRVDFRQQAKSESGDKWIKLNASERNSLVAGVRDKWSKANIGSIPEDISYPEWLGKQTVKFQDEVLGKSKAILFRQGGLKLSQFTDSSGSELTLAQLKGLYPQAFKKAGIKS